MIWQVNFSFGTIFESFGIQLFRVVLAPNKSIRRLINWSLSGQLSAVTLCSIVFPAILQLIQLNLFVSSSHSSDLCSAAQIIHAGLFTHLFAI